MILRVRSNGFCEVTYGGFPVFGCESFVALIFQRVDLLIAILGSDGQ